MLQENVLSVIKIVISISENILITKVKNIVKCDKFDRL